MAGADLALTIALWLIITVIGWPYAIRFWNGIK